jgi:hypothetical protein
MQGAQTRYRTGFPRDTRVFTSLFFENIGRLCSGFGALEGVDEGFLVLDFESLDHSAGGWVDIQKVGVGEGRDLWDVVVSSLSEKKLVDEEMCDTHRSSSWSLMEMPRTGPARIRFIK